MLMRFDLIVRYETFDSLAIFFFHLVFFFFSYSSFLPGNVSVLTDDGPTRLAGASESARAYFGSGSRSLFLLFVAALSVTMSLDCFREVVSRCFVTRIIEIVVDPWNEEEREASEPYNLARLCAGSRAHARGVVRMRAASCACARRGHIRAYRAYTRKINMCRVREKRRKDLHAFQRAACVADMIATQLVRDPVLGGVRVGTHLNKKILDAR